MTKEELKKAKIVIKEALQEAGIYKEENYSKSYLNFGKKVQQIKFTGLYTCKATGTGQEKVSELTEIANRINPENTKVFVTGSNYGVSLTIYF